jgi:hypothetical protein
MLATGSRKLQQNDDALQVLGEPPVGVQTRDMKGFDLRVSG